MTIPELLARAGRPELFQPSDAPFWDDPYISAQLLKMHLDDGIDAASRPAVVIRATVDRLVRDGVVSPGTRVPDLGCGPGRYAGLLASVGCRVTGVDLSTRSIAYARERAKERGLDIEYRVQDFHTLADVVGEGRELAEHLEHHVERRDVLQGVDVLHPVLDVQTALLGALAGIGDGPRTEVYPGHPAADGREQLGVPAGAAAEVEHARPSAAG